MKKAIFVLLFVTMAMAVWTDSDTGQIGVGAGYDGLFSIGVPPQPPITTDVTEILFGTYRHASPDGGFFNLYIDGKIYSNISIISLLYPDSAAYIGDFLTDSTYHDTPSNSIVTGWFIEGDTFGSDSVYVEQTLKPYEIGDSAFAKLIWRIQNFSGVAKEIGLLVGMDLCDMFASLMLPGTTITTSIILPDSAVCPTIPDYWEYEYSSGETAHFNISIPPNTPPNHLIYCDIHDMLVIFWEPVLTYSYVVDGTVIYQWLPMSVPPGGWIEYITTVAIPCDTFTAISETPDIPVNFAISAHPNPFNSAVTISLDGVGAIHELPLQIEIFDLAGRRIAQLPDGGTVGDGSPVPSASGHGDRAPTNREFIWTPDESLGSGVYLVRARFDSRSLSGAEAPAGAAVTKRIVYIK